MSADNARVGTQPRLIARWRLAGDARDSVGDHHGLATALTYTAGPQGASPGAASFDGVRSFVRVEDHPDLRLGADDFSVTAWIRCQAPMTSVFGDIISKFDPVGRCGLHLHVAGSSPAYSAMSDQRHVHFGIDDGYVGSWEDLGKPAASSSHVTALVTWEGDLYAGIADAATPDEACRVFRYGGGQTWRDCGRLCADPGVLSVQSMIVHGGRLYAGSGNWDWVKAKGGVPGFTPSKVHVYEYQGGTMWRDLGQVGEGYRVMCMGSFAGDLYAGMDSGAGGGKVFRYDGDRWVDCGAPDGANVECFLPSAGVLYVATHGCIYRYEGGTTWTSIGRFPHGISQIHCMAEVGGRLWVGTWPQGYVLRRERNGQWVKAGRLGIPAGLRECNEVMDLRVYNGKLYAGVIPKAQVWRYEADGHWTLMASLAARADWDAEDAVTWCRVTCLDAHGGRLCAATGTCYSRPEHQDAEDTLGRVHAFTAGQVCSHEHDIGGGWTHVAAVRAGKETRLYVNGTVSAIARAPARTVLNLTNTSPLLIGYGPQTYFTGAISDVRIYYGALNAEAVRQLGSVPG
ncbi:MAG: LamG-like jellyroll fold domain-containing protein [Armatimonadota bacterium]